MDAVVPERRIRRMDLGHVEVNRRTPLRFLAGRDNAYQKSNVAAIEERHLRRCIEEKRQAEDIPIEGDTPFEVIYGNQELADLSVCEAHRDLREWRLKVPLRPQPRGARSKSSTAPPNPSGGSQARCAMAHWPSSSPSW